MWLDLPGLRVSASPPRRLPPASRLLRATWLRPNRGCMFYILCQLVTTYCVDTLPCNRPQFFLLESLEYPPSRILISKTYLTGSPQKKNQCQKKCEYFWTRQLCVLFIFLCFLWLGGAPERGSGVDLFEGIATRCVESGSRQ